MAESIKLPKTLLAAAQRVLEPPVIADLHKETAYPPLLERPTQEWQANGEHLPASQRANIRPSELEKLTTVMLKYLRAGYELESVVQKIYFGQEVSIESLALALQEWREAINNRRLEI